jgi:flagellar protein FlgJ
MNINNLTSQLSTDSAATNPTSQKSKLHKAAQQFESLVIGEMMRSQREAGSEGWMGSGDDSASDSAMDIAESQFANALSAAGGLGLARMIETKMTQADSASVRAGVPSITSGL